MLSAREYKYLIVEDDPAFVDILKVFLNEISQIKCIGIADNTLDAARLIDLDKPDILFLDINISGLEGPEILELCDYKPQTIIISNHPKEVMENYEVEYVEYLQKPFEEKEGLVKAINQCIELINHKDQQKS